MEQKSTDTTKAPWLTKKIVFGLIICILAILLVSYRLVLDIVSIIQNDGLNYNKTYGTITAIEQNDITVEYPANGRSYQGRLKNNNYTERDINRFIPMFYNRNNPTSIDYTDYNVILRAIFLYALIIIVEILVIKQVLQKRYALSKKSHTKKVKLLGYSNGSLIYCNEDTTSNPKSVYYTLPIFQNDDYQKLIVNNQTTGTIIFADDNPKWWSFKYDEIKEALK